LLSHQQGEASSLTAPPIQERGLVTLIGLAVLVSGLLLLAERPAPEALLVSDAILLEDIEILLPVFVQAEPININRASQAELISLPGIGPALAQRIIDYRSEHGPFQSIDELQNVSGIGPQTVQDIQNSADAVAQ
jgi:competence ComEA-like helix-hairpin-helix protein